MYFDVLIKTRKMAQTGVRSTWRLYGNNFDPRICPLRALIRLTKVYGKDISIFFHRVFKGKEHGNISFFRENHHLIKI